MQTKTGRTGGGSVRITGTRVRVGEGGVVFTGTEGIFPSQIGSVNPALMRTLTNISIQALSPEGNAPDEEEEIIDTESVTSTAAAIMALQIQVSA